MIKLTTIKFLVKLLSRTTRPIVRRKHKLLQSNGELLVFEEVLPQKNKIGTIVFTHGLSEKGYQDKMTDKLIVALVAIGYQVILPLYTKLCQYDISPTVSKDFLVSFQTLLKHGYCTNNTIGLFSVSFSGPFVLKAAADPSIADSISAILLLGTPYSYQNIVIHEFSKTIKANLFVRLILLNNFFVAKFPPAFGNAINLAISKLSKSNSLKQLNYADFNLDGESANNFKALLESLEQNELKNQLCDLKIKDFEQQLSLSMHLDNLQASVAIIQGEDDETIPVSQAGELYHALTKHKIKACLTVTPLISHVQHKLSFKYLMKGNEMLNLFCFYFKSINDKAKQHGKI